MADTPIVALAAICLSGMLLTWVASLVVLALYRSRVVRFMQEGAATAPTVPSPPSRMRTAVMAARSADANPTAITTSVRARPRFAVATELLAGSAAALILAVGSGIGFDNTTPAFLVSQSLIYLWTSVLAAAVLTPRGWADLTWVVFGYFAALGALLVRMLLVNPDLTWRMVAAYWLLAAGVPTLLAMGTLARPIRAVGPLLFVYFSTCAFAGLWSATTLELSLGNPVVFAIARAWISQGLPFKLLEAAVGGVAFVIGGVVGLVPLLVARLLYTRKWESDLSLAIDSLWLIVTVFWAFEMHVELGATAFLVALAAFSAHRVVVAFLWGWSRRRYRPPAGRAPRLLFLRLFAQGRRRERLLHAVSQRWRYVGSIQMIAGPDLAAASVEPNELLDFLFGRLRGQFLRGPEDLERAVGTLDERPDPDGRYRTTELFCSASFWRHALQRVLADTDVVLVDVRGLASRSAGIAFELEQSRSLIAPDRALLLVDGATDLRVLGELLGVDPQVAAAGGLDARRLPRLLRVTDHLGRDARAITERLAAMALGHGVVSAESDARVALGGIVAD